MSLVNRKNNKIVQVCYNGNSNKLKASSTNIDSIRRIRQYLLIKYTLFSTQSSTSILSQCQSHRTSYADSERWSCRSYRNSGKFHLQGKPMDVWYEMHFEQCSYIRTYFSILMYLIATRGCDVVSGFFLQFDNRQFPSLSSYSALH